MNRQLVKATKERKQQLRQIELQQMNRRAKMANNLVKERKNVREMN